MLTFLFNIFSGRKVMYTVPVPVPGAVTWYADVCPVHQASPAAGHQPVSPAHPTDEFVCCLFVV